jgi:acyl-coenzyme A thioesterase PaaI-like protein
VGGYIIILGDVRGVTGANLHHLRLRPVRTGQIATITKARPLERLTVPKPGNTHETPVLTLRPDDNQ